MPPADVTAEIQRMHDNAFSRRCIEPHCRALSLSIMVLPSHTVDRPVPSVTPSFHRCKLDTPPPSLGTRLLFPASMPSSPRASAGNTAPSHTLHPFPSRLLMHPNSGWLTSAGCPAHHQHPRRVAPNRERVWTLMPRVARSCAAAAVTEAAALMGEGHGAVAWGRGVIGA